MSLGRASRASDPDTARDRIDILLGARGPVLRRGLPRCRPTSDNSSVTAIESGPETEGSTWPHRPKPSLSPWSASLPAGSSRRRRPRRSSRRTRPDATTCSCAPNASTVIATCSDTRCRRAGRCCDCPTQVLRVGRFRPTRRLRVRCVRRKRRADRPVRAGPRRLVPQGRTPAPRSGSPARGEAPADPPDPSAPAAGRHMSGAPSYRPAEGRLIIDASSRSRVRPVRDRDPRRRRGRVQPAPRSG